MLLFTILVTSSKCVKKYFVMYNVFRHSVKAKHGYLIYHFLILSLTPVSVICLVYRAAQSDQS
jgi:hypothetical protein